MPDQAVADQHEEAVVGKLRPESAGLNALVNALLADPIVRQHIAEDPELRNALSDRVVDAGTGTALGRAPTVHRLIDLTRALVVDSGVQSRIERDPELRALWSEPTVREWILQGDRP